MTYQQCISLNEEYHERLVKIQEKTGLKKIDIFKIGIAEVENSFKQGKTNE